MTGRRKSASKPTGPVATMQRRQRFHHDRLAAATTPDERIVAATAYLRAVLAHTDPERAGELAQEVVQMLWSRADRQAAANLAAETAAPTDQTAKVAV